MSTPNQPKRVTLPVLSSKTPEPALPAQGGDWSRRNFLQLMGGASVATLAAGCRPPHDTIKPYVTKPDDITPSLANHYATAISDDGIATGLLVTAYEGRPTKIEGNPRHPVTRGGTSGGHQAAILDLYDPTRAKVITHKGLGVSRETFLGSLHKRAEALKDKGGEGLSLLLEPSSSPLLAQTLAELQKAYPAAVVRFYSPMASSAESRATIAAFGKALTAQAKLEHTEIVLSLDSDFLDADNVADGLRNSNDFGKRRDDDERLFRVYVAEADFSPTGSIADHRFPMKKGEVAPFGRAVLAAVARLAGAEAQAALVEAAAGATTSVDAKIVEAVAKDLWAHRGKSVVLAGASQPEGTHQVAIALNSLLQSVGATLEYRASPLLDSKIGRESLAATVADIEAGKVQCLIVGAYDPVATRPGDLDVAAAFALVPTLVQIGNHVDATAKFAEWFAPLSHVLESWGDVRSSDGTISLVQPLIAPLYNSVTIEEVVSALVSEAPRSAHDLLRASWKMKSVGDADAFWENALQTGFIEKSAFAAETVNLNAAACGAAIKAIAAAATGVELAFSVDRRIGDGRQSANPWLLELPDPVTKLTWDNAFHISPATAKGLGIDREHVIELAGTIKPLRGPVFVVPGHADDALTVHVGWGQRMDEDGDAKIGFDAYPASPKSGASFVGGISITATKSRYALAVTQGHFSQEKRDLAIVADAAEEEHLKERIHEKHAPIPTLYKQFDYQGYKWAMAVDLGKCTGCSACVVACVAENNVPVVGKDNVRRGREMHWLRIDRYYEGPDSNPVVVQQPSMCVHCENAPCEYVCPVNATVHNEEGLNEMVYNRCVGTRYCSNNCPYKARRFNFFAYNSDKSLTEQMAMNPEVTVRARGVMEKCTYCVQRIEKARITSEIEGRTIRDGEVQVACQQACATGAIVFGTLSDEHAHVTHLHHDHRRYDLLHSLGTRPRTAYLARVTHRNPEIA